MGKILLVFKRFRVEGFVWMRRVEIFILNFSRYRFYSHARVLRNTLPIRSSFSRDDVKLTHIGAIWPVQSIPDLCRVVRYKRRIVLTFWNLFQVGIKLTIGPEMEIAWYFYWSNLKIQARYFVSFSGLFRYYFLKVFRILLHLRNFTACRVCYLATATLQELISRQYIDLHALVFRVF
jgi:hypothetical protein